MGRAPTLDEVVTILRQHEALFRAKGVAHLAVFGSVARGEAGETSDVDLVIDLDPAARFSLLDLVGLEQDSADWLGRKVDILTRCCLRPPMAERIRRDAFDVF